MATNALAAMLDELMGRDRNLAPTEKKNELHWEDAEVCKHYLCGFCPHELFVNTRADLGPCFKMHDDALRKEYQKSNRFKKMGYEEDFLRYLQGLISDCEKRIRRGHQRLALNNQQGSLTNTNSMPDGKEERIKLLTERINELVQQAEELGCEGKVEESQGVMKLCDQLREERTQLETSTNQSGTDFVKTMEVCTVCGALLVVNDVQQRTEEHLMGKQHSGWARIRAHVESRFQERQKTDEEREAKLIKEREEREKEREKEREERRRKEKEREKEREKEKEKEREREREREKRRRSRSRSRDRRRRSRSGSRHRRRRSRSRSRDRHRSRRHRSRSRSRSRSKRSRSRDRDRDRDRKRSRSRDRSSKSKSRSSKDQKDQDSNKDRDSKDREKRFSEPKETQPQETPSSEKAPDDDKLSEINGSTAENTMDEETEN